LFPEPDDPDGAWYAPGDDLSVFSGQDSMFVSRIFYWYLSEVQDAIQSGDWSKPNEILDMISTYQTAKNNVPGWDKGQIVIELKYNKLEVFRWCKIGYLSLGGLLLLFSFILFFKDKRSIRRVILFVGAGVLFVFLFHITGMAMRWKIGGYAPWSNSYETMVFMAFATVMAGFLFARRSPVTFSLATLFAGIILFVSGLNWMDPQINPLVPVLKSPWLMFHVAILMAAYGFFGISFLLGLVNLLLMAFSRKMKSAAPIQELSIINGILLIIGLILMTIGTFMGAVWANESWGRYWGWDPKETWALITMIVYAMVTHLHLLRKGDSLWLFNLCSVVAFATVLMTYFGVNYFLSGMHSYGQ
jgi:cytochrome c-type biogenesis protein CcsB